MSLGQNGCAEHMMLSRRGLLTTAASLSLWSLLPRVAIAGTRDPRLLVIVLRGAVDGLALAAPVGDPAYVSLRRKLAVPKDGAGAGLPLDGFFVLNSAMPFLHGLYQKREALLIHAVATPYRGRSHFDGQDVLESGLGGVAPSESGWLNRALAGLPHVGSTAALQAVSAAAPQPVSAAAPQAVSAAAPQQGLSMGAVVPLVMRGSAPVMSWTPKAYSLPLRDQTVERLMDLYAHTDVKLAKAFAEGLEIDRIAQVGAAAPLAAAKPLATSGQPAPSGQPSQRGVPPNVAQPAVPSNVAQPAVPSNVAQPAPARPFRDFIETAEAAAKFMTTSGGPRIGALSFDGWDTHANEGVITGQLANKFAGLDAAIRAFAEGMGPAWADTVVLIITEFGRTARTNGTEGTDHGTGGAALLVGGAVNGGRVLADWPGLSDAALYEGRDLKPTQDLRSIMKGVLRDHLGIPDGALGSVVFPGSAAIKGSQGLIV
jgi:uncharacterized protein (DUF1501 family)